jgi:hypothetical protein
MILKVLRIRNYRKTLFTKTGQDASVIDAGEEWTFMIWGFGGRVKHSFVQLFLFLDMPLNV